MRLAPHRRQGTAPHESGAPHASRGALLSLTETKAPRARAVCAPRRDGQASITVTADQRSDPMAYRLDLREHPGDALRRSAADRIEHAIAQLDDGVGHDRSRAVHEARKDVKKARALLRLARGALGAAAYRRENRALRDAGRELSVVRDADVLPVTVDALAERYAGQLPIATFDSLRAAVSRSTDGVPAGSGEHSVDAARARLARVLGRVEEWPLRRAGRRSLVEALERSYARGRDALERAERDPSDERLHDWRKRVKDLRYQQRLLSPAWPAVLGAQADAAKDLSELLGDDHDLAVLDARVREDGAVADEVIDLIAHRRRELQSGAFDLGHRIYAESPPRFAKRIGRYLRAAARDAEPPVAA
jgi:CHAD domain-containing protein